VHFALSELGGEMRNSQREEVLRRLRQHLQDVKRRRVPHL
jgi:hypothetical protein